MTTVTASNEIHLVPSDTSENVDCPKEKRLQRDMEDKLIAQAVEIVHRRLITRTMLLSSAKLVRDYLALQLTHREQEVFCCLLLDNQHRLIVFREMFFGTVDGCSVYPREVVKLALRHNAAAMIFAHNHPSGIAEPSQSDMRITERLTQALELVDVRVLDHLIVGAGTVVSFAEQGLLV